MLASNRACRHPTIRGRPRHPGAALLALINHMVNGNLRVGALVAGCPGPQALMLNPASVPPEGIQELEEACFEIITQIDIQRI
jgi:hypothetical protein